MPYRRTTQVALLSRGFSTLINGMKVAVFLYHLVTDTARHTANSVTSAKLKSRARPVIDTVDSTRDKRARIHPQSLTAFNLRLTKTSLC